MSATWLAGTCPDGMLQPVYTLLALSSSVLYGLWKFGIGRYRGAISVYSVIFVSASAAAVVYLVAGYLANDLVFDRFDVTRGLLGGALNVTGTILVLKAFERGPMGVVTSVAASSTLVPLVYSFMAGEAISALAGVGIALILAGLLVFYVPTMTSGSNSPRLPRAIMLSLLAALAWGLAIVVLDIGARVSVSTTLFVSQIPQVAFAALMLAFVTRSWGGLARSAIVPLAAAGLALGLANLAFFTAAEEGDVGVVSVLGSLSPLVTAVLAYLILHEKLRRSQQVALLIVLGGTCLIVR